MVFLLANVFTGLINVSVPTLFVSDALSFLIIVAYIFAVCAVPYVIRTSPKTSTMLLFQST
jgi:phosphatidylinositol glycan class W